MHTDHDIRQRYTERDRSPACKHVIACVDRSEHAGKIIPHACAIARALEVPLTLLRVLEARPTNNFRPDPIEWDIRRHEARTALKRQADACVEAADVVDIELVEGRAVDEICRWTREQAAELIVLGTHGDRASGENGIGGTARNVLDRSTGSVLLVPVLGSSAHTPNYRRILVPVDGSPWAESAVPLAVRLARAADAELLLVHVVPAPELTETEPLDLEDLALLDQVVARNERVARSYLNRVHGYASGQDIQVRTLTLRDHDVRGCLANLISTESVDLVVLSARGHGCNRVSDLPFGNVASYLMTHSIVPTLIVRVPGEEEPLDLHDPIDALVV